MAILKEVGKWAFYLLLGWIWDKLVRPLWVGYQAEQEARKIAEENLRKYKAAIEGGNDEEAARVGSDLINGYRR